jgi:hypothetical protein
MFTDSIKVGRDATRCHVGVFADIRVAEIAQVQGPGPPSEARSLHLNEVAHTGPFLETGPIAQNSGGANGTVGGDASTPPNHYKRMQDSAFADGGPRLNHHLLG